MAFVDMKCPNCGAPLGHGISGDRFECPYCHSIILNIVDAKINADVDIIDAQTFARKLEESRRMFLVRADDGIKVFDSQTAIINKRIKDAKVWLEAGRFGEAGSLLEGLPDDIPSVIRMRLLIRRGVRNECELSFVKGNIRDELFEKFVSVCPDKETVAAYHKIAEICALSGSISDEIKRRRKEVFALMDNGLYKEAVVCANKVCGDYPQTAESWALLAAVKRRFDGNYNCRREVAIMRCCPDHEYRLLPDSVQSDIREFDGYGKKYIGSAKAFCLFLLGACVLIALSAFELYILYFSPAEIAWFIYLLLLACGLAAVVFVCISVYKFVCLLRNYSGYGKILSAIPLTEVKLFHASKFLVPSLTVSFALISVAVRFILGFIGEVS